MKKILIITSLAATSALFGDTIVTTPTDPSPLWQTVVNPVTVNAAGKITSNVNSTPNSNAYWNNGSTDAPLNGGATGCYNIGCFMTGTDIWDPIHATIAGAPNNTPNLDNPVYLGHADGSAFQNFSFNGPGFTGGTTMLAEVAGNSDRNWLGWYDASLPISSLNAGNRGTAWNIIYTGTDTVGATATFTPTTNFGLFLFGGNSTGPVPSGIGDTAGILAILNGTVAGAQGAYFTQSAKDAASADPNQQHFALFATSAAAAGTVPADFWVGAEDTNLATADKDYNDMVVRLRIVPEPGYFVLLSLGLGGLGLIRRRMNNAA